MGFEGLDTSFSPSFEPLTDCPLTDSQCSRYLLLLPALLFELPGLHSSFFSPIGFSRCSHTSYFSILYFRLPRSVIAHIANDSTRGHYISALTLPPHSHQECWPDSATVSASR